MKNSNLFTFLFLLSGILSGIKAQQVLPLTFSETYSSFAPSTITTGTITSKFVLTLSDTLNINSIELKIGSSPDQQDVVLSTIQFDDASSLPNNFTYSRKGYDVSIEIDALELLDTYFSTIRIQDLSGTWSPPIKVVNN